MVFLGFWIVSVGATLFIARDRLDMPKTRFKDELLARSVAFCAATASLGGFGLLATVVTSTPQFLIIIPLIWILSVLPLFLPPIRRGDHSAIISSSNWVATSVAVTVLGGFFMSLSILVRLILRETEIL